MNVILAFDKFKGSMTSREAAEAAERGIRAVCKDAVCTIVPAADGGEGTVDAFLSSSSMNGEKQTCIVTHLLVDEMYNDTHIEAAYAIVKDGDTACAVMEMAAASGLALVPKEMQNPLHTTTYGTGEMIKDALDHGCTRFLIGIGGSATNDGGCGMAAALGVRFLDKTGVCIPMPTGGDLEEIAEIDCSHMDPRLKACTFTICCDVDNPLCGPHGAAYVYAPQKGASPEDVVKLDRGLSHLASLLVRDAGAPETIASFPGAGAAGGLGAGMHVFLGGKLIPGAEAVMDASGLDACLEHADLLLTGEGKLDGQTVHGKTVAGFLRRANRKNVPVIAFGGCVEEEADALYAQGISGLFSIARGPATLEDSMKNAPALLEARVKDVIMLLTRTGALK